MLKSLKDFKIRFKIALLLNIFALFIIALVSIALTQQFKQALQDRILLQLSSIRHLKTIQIKEVLNNYLHEINTMLIHLDDDAYLDALAHDQLIHVDSIHINHEMMAASEAALDSILIEDLSAAVNNGNLYLAFNVPFKQQIYTFYAAPGAIQNILFERTGMGHTGETYIIGEEGNLRSQSRFWTDSLPTQIKSQTEAFGLAQQQNEGLIRHLDYRQIPVFSSFAPFNYYGLRWVVLSEIDVEEALLPLKAMEKRIYLIASLLAITIFLISNFLAWYIVHPVLKVKNALTTISKGQRPLIPRYHSKDEIGDLFASLEVLIATLDQVIGFANHIAHGEFNTTMVMRSPDDRLVSSLNNMKTQLVEIQERERQLQSKSQKLLMAGEEKERSRLSRELHDSIGPLLTNLKLVASQPGDDQALLEQRIQHIIEEVRKISVNLMPSVLKDFGLSAAIQSFLQQLPPSARNTISFASHREEQTSMPADLALNAFRIVQEAINNALKHARATEIKLSVTEFSEQVNIFIADNGMGFDPEDVTLGNGILNIKERVKLFEGHLDIQSNRDGTTIEIEFLTKPAL